MSAVSFVCSRASNIQWLARGDTGVFGRHNDVENEEKETGGDEEE